MASAQPLDPGRTLFHETHVPNSSKAPLSILQLFFNGCFYLGFSPFRIKWNSKSRSYFAVTYKLQAVLCGCMHLLSTKMIVEFVIRNYERVSIRDESFVSHGLDFISQLASAVMCALLIKHFWTDKKIIVDIINKAAVPSQTTKATKVAILLLGLCLLSSTLSEDSKTQDECEDTIVGEANWSNITRTNSIGAKVPPVPAGTSGPLEFLWDYVCTYLYIFYIIQHCFRFSISCSLLQVARHFQQELSACGTNVDKGLELCRGLRASVDLVNRAFGWHLLTFYTVVTTYYCQIPDILMGYMNTTSHFAIITFVVIHTVAWVISAEFHSLVNQSIFRWYETCMFNNPPDCDLFNFDKASISINAHVSGNSASSSMENRMKLMAIRNDIYNEPIGLSCRFFIVTYGFISSMVGLIVTYGIIVFQMRSGKLKSPGAHIQF